MTDQKRTSGYKLSGEQKAELLAEIKRLEATATRDAGWAEALRAVLRSMRNAK